MKKVICRSVLFGIFSLMGFLNALAETTISDVLPKGATTIFNAKYQYGTKDGDNWPGDPANDGNDRAWNAKDFDDSSWGTKPVPFGSDLSGDQKWEGEYNCYWLRISFNLDAVDNTATYYFLCRHDDTYKAYINGNEIANRSGWTGDGYCYVPISGSYLSAGTNVIAVYIQQNYGGSYFDCGVQKYNYQQSDFDTRFKGAEVTNGEFYLYNPASGLWLQNNDRIRKDWNTRAELGTRGLDFTLTKQGNGGYYLKGKFNAASCPSIQAGNRYLDTNSADAWHFEKVNVPGLTNAYKVTYWPTDQNDYTLTGSSQSPTASTNLFTPTVNNDIFLDCFRTRINDYSIWVLVTKEQRLAMMMSATNAVPQDATWLIKNADFADKDDRASAWEKTGTFTYNGRNDDNNTRFGRVYESFNTENVEFSQTISNLPAGKYRMRVQGFYRGGEAKMFAGSTEQAMLSETTTDDMWTVARDMYYNGKYIGNWMEFTHMGGDLKLGIKKGAKSTDTDWIIFSKFALEYMGTEGLNNLPFSFMAYNGNYRGSGLYSYLFDGNTDTKWEVWPNWDNGSNYYFANENANVLFAASEPIYVNGLTLYTGADTQTYPNRNPKDWYLYGTNDVNVAMDMTSDSWNLIECVGYAQMPAENAVGKYYKFNPSQTAYKYFKFHVYNLVGKDELQLSELVLDYSTEAKAPIQHIANSGGNPGSGEIAEKIFDGPSTTKWYRYSKNNWVVFKTANPIYVSSYIIQTANDAEGRDPKKFKLYGALGDAAPTTDGTTTGWTEIDSEDDASGTIPTDRYAFANFTIDKPGIYQYFMLKVEDTRSANDFQLSEFIIDNDEDIFYIASDDDMVEFARKVNEDGKTSLHAVLMADIDMTNKGGTWWPIGQTDASGTENDGSKAYKGTFEGNFHTIDNLVQNDNTHNNQGLFGVVNGGCVIKNLILGSGCHFKGAKFVGAFVGSSRGSGWVTIQNCGNEGAVTASGNNAAAIIGCVINGGPATRITDCYNKGNVSGNAESAILTGWFGGHGSVEVNNFYNTGTISGHDGRHLYRNSVGITFNNVYHTSANQSATEIGEGWLTSGELCYKLGASFKQDLSQENYPIPFGSKTVYAGKWFNDTDNDVYYNLEDGSYMVYKIAMDETHTAYNVPANVTVKNFSFTRTYLADQWIGMCAPISFNRFEDWEVREFASVNGNGESASMIFTTASSIVAGKPYLIKPSRSEAMTIMMGDVHIISAADAESESTKSIDGINMIGNLHQTNITTGDFYINTSSQMKKLTAASATLKAFRAYFTVDGGNVKALSIAADDDATLIQTIDNGQQTTEGAIYNLAGQRLNKMQRGINIIGGKKMVIGK